MLCNCKGAIHSFACYLRNIADSFVAGRNNR